MTATWEDAALELFWAQLPASFYCVPASQAIVLDEQGLAIGQTHGEVSTIRGKWDSVPDLSICTLSLSLRGQLHYISGTSWGGRGRRTLDVWHARNSLDCSGGDVASF